MQASLEVVPTGPELFLCMPRLGHAWPLDHNGINYFSCRAYYELISIWLKLSLQNARRMWGGPAPVEGEGSAVEASLKKEMMRF